MTGCDTIVLDSTGDWCENGHDWETAKAVANSETAYSSVNTITYIQSSPKPSWADYCEMSVKYTGSGGTLLTSYGKWVGADSNDRGFKEFPTCTAAGNPDYTTALPCKNDQNAGTTTVDEGILTSSWQGLAAFPPTSFKFGDLGDSSETGTLELGKLKCGQIDYSSDCESLSFSGGYTWCENGNNWETEGTVANSESAFTSLNTITWTKSNWPPTWATYCEVHVKYTGSGGTLLTAYGRWKGNDGKTRGWDDFPTCTAAGNSLYATDKPCKNDQNSGPDTVDEGTLTSTTYSMFAFPPTQIQLGDLGSASEIGKLQVGKLKCRHDK
jgi:hypothetical protein